MNFPAVCQTCERCGAEHATYFGLIFCPDCGKRMVLPLPGEAMPRPKKKAETPFEFHFASVGRGRFKVVASQDNFSRRISHLNKLMGQLLRKIPFPYKQAEELTMDILGESKHRRQLVLEIIIEPEGISDIEALVIFKEVGFISNIEEVAPD